MSDLQGYFNELAVREGKPAVQIARWDPACIKQINQDFDRAVGNCGFSTAPMIAAESVSNQVVGNTMAKFFSRQLNAHLQQFRIDHCPGSGYPDKCLVYLENGQEFALELKATEEFDPEDTNRMVLTCASDKLRRSFAGPVSHLLAAVCYRRVRDAIVVCSVRLQYFEPWTPVNIRLEASTSKALLSSQPANFVWIHVKGDDVWVAA